MNVLQKQFAVQYAVLCVSCLSWKALVRTAPFTKHLVIQTFNLFGLVYLQLENIRGLLG